MKILSINLKPDFSYFEKKGLKFQVDYKTTDQVFPLIKLYQMKTSTGEMVDTYSPDITNYVKQFSGYSAVLVGWNPEDYDNKAKYSGGFTFPNPLPNGCFYVTVRVGKNPNPMFPIHEMMHVLCGIININFGHHIPKDFMDYTQVNGQWLPYYINDPNSNDPQSNFNQTWIGIIPFIDRLNKLNKETKITIERFSDDGVQTLGDLSINGKFFCKTLERPWKQNKKNISCIPKGTYNVKWTFSPRLLKYTYEVQNVPGRSGIRFHPGNYFFDIDGCILLGSHYVDLNHDKWADIANSKVTLAKFEKTVNNLPFILEIK